MPWLKTTYTVCLISWVASTSYFLSTISYLSDAFYCKYIFPQYLLKYLCLTMCNCYCNNAVALLQCLFIGSVYFTSRGKSTAGAILPLVEHDCLKWSHDNFKTHDLLSCCWPWCLLLLSMMHKCCQCECHGFIAGKLVAASCLRCMNCRLNPNS